MIAKLVMESTKTAEILMTGPAYEIHWNCKEDGDDCKDGDGGSRLIESIKIAKW